MIYILLTFLSHNAFAVYGGKHVGSEDPIAHHAVSILSLTSVGSCTGTVIHPHFILTAAHCVIDKKSGEPGRDFVIESEDGKWSVTSRTVKAHEEYDRHSLSNDVALIYLNTSVPKQFSPARLVSREPLAGNTVYGAGFGIGHSDGGLYKVKLSLSDKEYSGFINWWQSDKQGTCKGDSGGGIWIHNELAGVISHYSAQSPGHCQGMNYATSVADYRDWIAKKMAKISQRN